jgi:hypothetical protein
MDETSLLLRKFAGRAERLSKKRTEQPTVQKEDEGNTRKPTPYFVCHQRYKRIVKNQEILFSGSLC